MSSKLVKQPGHLLELPNDKCIVDLKVFTSGKVQLAAPEVAPQDLCKMLHGLIVDITYNALQKVVESSRIYEARNEQTEAKDN